jgi:hypothetical protein
MVCSDRVRACRRTEGGAPFVAACPTVPRRPDVARHEADLAKQDEYGVHYKRQWVDEKAGKAFWLVEGGRMLRRQLASTGRHTGW